MLRKRGNRLQIYGINPRLARQHVFLEFDHEIFLRSYSLLPVEEGQLSVSGEIMCTSTCKPLRVLSMLRKKV